jgi:hypothetical protein
MPKIAYLSRNIWALGELTEPKLILLFDPPTDTTLTITYALYNEVFMQVTDAVTKTIATGTSRYVIDDLGDYLNAQQSVKGFSSGFYFLIVKIDETGEIFTLPLIVTLGYTTIPDVDDIEYLQYITVLDLVTGTHRNLPKTMTYIPVDPRFRVYLYFHKNNKGRLVGLTELGTVDFDTGYHQLVVGTFTLKFNSVDDMLYHMLLHSYGLTDSAILAVMESIRSGNYTDALKVLIPFYSYTWIGRMLAVEVDTVNKEIKIEAQLYLGQWSWEGFLAGGVAGCVAGVGVALIAGAFGLIPLSGAIIAGACALGFATGGVIGAKTLDGKTISASIDEPRTLKDYWEIMKERYKYYEDKMKNTMMKLLQR